MNIQFQTIRDSSRTPLATVGSTTFAKEGEDFVFLTLVRYNRKKEEKPFVRKEGQKRAEQRLRSSAASDKEPFTANYRGGLSPDSEDGRMVLGQVLLGKTVGFLREDLPVFMRAIKKCVLNDQYRMDIIREFCCPDEY